MTSVTSKPELSVIVILHEMRREAKRTLFSLSPRYQRCIDFDYEVLVIDHASRHAALDTSAVSELGDAFRYSYFETESPSPTEAINFFVRSARSDNIMILIDGARILSPGIFDIAIRGGHVGDDRDVARGTLAAATHHAPHFLAATLCGPLEDGSRAIGNLAQNLFVESREQEQRHAPAEHVFQGPGHLVVDGVDDLAHAEREVGDDPAPQVGCVTDSVEDLPDARSEAVRAVCEQLLVQPEPEPVQDHVAFPPAMAELGSPRQSP